MGGEKTAWEGSYVGGVKRWSTMKGRSGGWGVVTEGETEGSTWKRGKQGNKGKRRGTCKLRREDAREVKEREMCRE